MAGTLLALFVLVTGSVIAVAQSVNDGRTIAYQGRLDLDGAPVEGTVPMTFRFFDLATAGNQLGVDMQHDVDVAAGNFAETLGPVPDAAFTGGALFLEIEVDGVVLGARQQILAVPFAMGTGQAERLRVSGTAMVRGEAGITLATADREAALQLGDGSNGSGAGAGTLDVGRSVIEIPLGDEAAGGMYLWDAQDEAQHGIVAWDSSSERLSLTTNNDTGLHVEPTGDVEADGVIRWSCPANMARLGTWCIDKVKHAKLTYENAFRQCHNEGKQICPFEVLMWCDLEPNATRIGDCWAETDGTNNTDSIWSAMTSHAAFTEDAFSIVATYNGDDNSIDRSPNSTPYISFCCVPGSYVTTDDQLP